MEEIIRLKDYEPLWGEWKVDSLMYEGNLSNVYAVKNESATAVIKVISVPKLQLEGRMASQSSTENQEAMSGFFKEVVSALENEMERISVVNSIPNVLSYRKYEAFERKTEIGFDLVLLMDKEESLQEYIAARPHIKNNEIVKIVKEIAWILDRAHREGILHKDIKLENVFIAESGESMLADFALARKIESYQSRLQRKVDSTYVAPEVLSEYDYSEETDVYALGMVLYILLNDGNIPSEVVRRTFNTDIPKPVRAGEQLAAVTQKAISYRARDRYRSAEEFFKALSALKEEDFVLPADYASQVEMKRMRELEEERRRKVEEERKAEEERLRREEEERLAEDERLKREEEERKAEEERWRREDEEQKRKLEESAKELEQRVQGMVSLVNYVKFDADGREIYDRDEEARKDFTDYSPEYNEEKLDDVFEQITEEKEKEEANTRATSQYAAPEYEEIAENYLEEECFDNSTLLGQIEELDSTPEFHIHSDAAEYSGFFDFEKEAYKAVEKEKRVEYDKSMDEEPFEQKMAVFPKEPARRTPFILLFILLVLLAAGVFCWQNKEIRGKIQEMYSSFTAVIEESFDSFSENNAEIQL